MRAGPSATGSQRQVGARSATVMDAVAGNVVGHETTHALPDHANMHSTIDVVVVVDVVDVEVPSLVQPLRSGGDGADAFTPG